MVKTLLRVARASKTTVAEIAGAGVIVYGVAQYSGPAAWIVAGVAVLAKSMEWDLDEKPTTPSGDS
jgi:hypothetical protein